MNKFYLINNFYKYIYLNLSLFSFIYSILFLYQNYILIIEWNMISMNSFQILLSIMFDWMSLMFISFVLIISSMTMIYSKSYMNKELNNKRFINLIMLFITSMIFLIINSNLIFMLIGWDGLGLTSFILVVYYQNNKSLNASLMTVLSNRIGDVMILMSIALLLMNMSNMNYYMNMKFIPNNNLLLFLLILASMTKSAQIPFSSWLPAAMAAPTPVSALVHSSTLVTAGIYLMIRFNYLLMNSYLNKMLMIISMMTLMIASMAANYEFDMKKIIALSTLSQLSLMMMTLSISLYKLTFFHLLMHALFKALLFFCTGNLIHNLKSNQDMRYSGSNIKSLPMNIMYLNMSMMALCGLPFLTGFYSKDLILEMISMNKINFFMYLLIYFSMGLTMMYSIRFIYFNLINNILFMNLNTSYDKNLNMFKSMMIMFILSITIGSILNWSMNLIPLFIFLNYFKKMLIYLFLMMGFIQGYLIMKMKFNLKKINSFINKIYFFTKMWFMYNLSTYKMNYYPLMTSNLFIKIMEMGWNELSVFFYKKMIKYFIYENNNYINKIKLSLFMFMMWMNLLILIMLLI